MWVPKLAVVRKLLGLESEVPGMLRDGHLASGGLLEQYVPWLSSYLLGPSPKASRHLSVSALRS